MVATAASSSAKGPTVRYLAVAVPARLADEGARIALVLLAMDRVHSASLGGLLVAALMIPHVVAAPVAGALADHVRRRGLLHGLGLAAYGTGLIAAAWTIGRLPTACVLLLVTAAGCCAPLLTGGLTGLLAELVPREVLPRVFSIDSATYNLAGICGPALAAALAALTGPGHALAALGAAALLSGFAVTLLRLPARARTEGRAAPLRPAVLAAGARELIRNPPLRSVTWASAIGQAGIGALPVITALLAGRYRQDWAAGGLMTAFAAGAMAGSLTYALRPWTRTRPERVVLLCLPLSGIPLALAACVSGPLVAAGLFVLAGWFKGPLFSALLAAREQYAPAPLRTQVFTLGAGLKSTAAAAGAAAVGAAAHLGAVPLLLAAAVVQVVAALTGAALLGRHAAPRPRPARSGTERSATTAPGAGHD
ncbi:MFS transporter [Streptomyces sp. NPDC052701]|uniref:MFS transporter n=1 Tax=Streptomyces sp. NPDC052701 TaxID=3155533 RepID=UPI003417756F